MRWVVEALGHPPPPLPPLLPLPQPKLTPQEKLKLRMQKALNRQCMSPRLPLMSSKLPLLASLGEAFWGEVGVHNSVSAAIMLRALAGTLALLRAPLSYRVSSCSQGG